MPRKSRKLLGEILCHHMVQGINKEYIFQTTEEKEKYLNLLKKYYKQFKIDIIAYCIMDNHAHMLLYSDKIDNISDFMQKVNSIYAMDYNKNKNRVGYVFRNRFESVPIFRREQMYTCIKYIHMNPVKANIVKKENEYKYSSYNDYIKREGIINNKVLKLVFGSMENYIEKFQEIEYTELNLENEKIDINILLQEFLNQENIKIEQLNKNRILIQKFISFLVLRKYKFSKVELAKTLKIGRATLYRWLYD